MVNPSTVISDIVERLLWRRADGTLVNPLGPEAADTITALTAEVERLRADRQDILDQAQQAVIKRDNEITRLTAEAEALDRASQEAPAP